MSCYAEGEYLKTTSQLCPLPLDCRLVAREPHSIRGDPRQFEADVAQCRVDADSLPCGLCGKYTIDKDPFGTVLLMKLETNLED